MFPKRRTQKSSCSPFILSITYARGICPRLRVKRKIDVPIPITSRALSVGILFAIKIAKIGPNNPSAAVRIASDAVKKRTVGLISDNIMSDFILFIPYIVIFSDLFV